MNSFSNNVQFKSDVGQIKYSDAFGQYHFKGKTAGLAIKYVVKGTETYCVNNSILKVPENHFLLVRPETDFEAVTEQGCSETQGVCIDLSVRLKEADVERILSNKLLFTQSFGYANATLIGAHIDSIAPKIKQGNKAINNKKCLVDMGLYLSRFSENIFQFKKDLYTIAKKESTQDNIILNLLRGKEFIQTHYRNKISLDDIASHAKMSKFQFQKLFKTCFHYTPQALQSSLRMSAAKELLRNTEQPISAIAFDLGYFDLAAFSKKFKSSFGLSPSQYKNQQDFTSLKLR